MDEANISQRPKGQKQKKKVDGKIITIIILAFLALGSATFGIFEIIQNNKNNTEIAEPKTDAAKTEPAENKPTETETSNDTKTAQETSGQNLDWAAKALAEKYYSVKVCDSPVIFGETYNDSPSSAKALIAFANLTYYGSTFLANGANIKVPASELNDKYQELFGKSSKLIDDEYVVTKGGPVFTATESYGTRYYEYQPFGAGCAPDHYWLTKYAGYSLNGNQLVVSVIHDVASDDGNGMYITLASGEKIEFPPSDYRAYTTTKEQDEAAAKILEQRANDLQHYNLVFSKEDEHYVLASIEKN